ncbi:MAG: hypothetical protein ACJ76F_04075 [Bacteroidia bacterium]
MIRVLKFILFTCSLAVRLYAQDDVPAPITVKLPLVSIRLNAGIPNPSSNEVFRRKFIGIYETNFSLSFRIKEWGFIGIGYKNGLLSVSNRLKYGINTKMEMNTAYVKVGYNHFHSNKTFSTFFLNMGYNKSKFTGVVCLQGTPPDPHVSAPVIEPGYSINFFAEDNMTLGFYTSVNFMTWRFDPTQVCFEQVTSLSGLSTSRNTTYINIGLELYWGLGKRKK